jgi:hypothetical protein
LYISVGLYRYIHTTHLLGYHTLWCKFFFNPSTSVQHSRKLARLGSCAILFSSVYVNLNYSLLLRHCIEGSLRKRSLRCIIVCVPLYLYSLRIVGVRATHSKTMLLFFFRLWILYYATVTFNLMHLEKPWFRDPSSSRSDCFVFVLSSSLLSLQLSIVFSQFTVWINTKNLRQW